MQTESQSSLLEACGCELGAREPQHAALSLQWNVTHDGRFPFEAFNLSAVSDVRYADRHDDEHSGLVALSETSTQTEAVIRPVGMHFRYALGAQGALSAYVSSEFDFAWQQRNFRRENPPWRRSSFEGPSRMFVP